jgi:hypothetical protein
VIELHDRAAGVDRAGDDAAFDGRSVDHEHRRARRAQAAAQGGVARDVCPGALEEELGVAGGDSGSDRRAGVGRVAEVEQVADEDARRLLEHHLRVACDAQAAEPVLAAGEEQGGRLVHATFEEHVAVGSRRELERVAVLHDQPRAVVAGRARGGIGEAARRRDVRHDRAREGLGRTAAGTRLPHHGAREQPGACGRREDLDGVGDDLGRGRVEGSRRGERPPVHPDVAFDHAQAIRLQALGGEERVGRQVAALGRGICGEEGGERREEGQAHPDRYRMTGEWE